MLFEQGKNSIQNWFRESVMVKLVLIGILTLFLLIPSNMIQGLIAERQQRQDEVVNEITDKWSGNQLIEGPILVLPYKNLSTQKDSTGKLSYTETLSNVHILPEILTIQSNAEPEIRERGIFNAVVYNNKLKVQGNFSALELKKSGLNPERIVWDKAKVVIGLSDLKGLKNNPVIKLGKVEYPVEADFSTLQLFKNNLVAITDLSQDKNTALSFSFDLDHRGSNALSFLHLGKTTHVQLNGKWSDPSFTGNYLPEQPHIQNGQFSASWKLPYFNRPFPQQWTEENAVIDTTAKDASFGVKFLLPVDQYQKSMRTAKYAILIILLTFIALLFTELIHKKRVHLLQYTLIGAAMTIYYTLLLSFSEHLGFNLAYLIASVATVLLITVFLSALLRNNKAAILFGGILSIFYCFVFVIVQLQDMALLFGSIGLFIIIAVLMYLTSKIDWDKRSTPTTVND